MSFDMSITYYLVGPMTGLPEHNYRMFEYATDVLRGYGITVLTPHEHPWPKNYKDMSPDILWTYMMNETRELLERADGIILLPGWCYSKGSLIELELARKARLPTWFFEPTSKSLLTMEGSAFYETFYREDG